MNLDLSKPDIYIKSDATNSNGLAFVANTGDAGNDKRKYDPSYKAKMIKGSYKVTKPENSTVNIASIPGSVHKYMYVESFKINAKVKEKAKITYKKISVPKKAKKYIKVSSKGKVTVKKGLKKGKYKVKVNITAAATKHYAKTVTKKTINIIIK